jgi:hypothetical protein
MKSFQIAGGVTMRSLPIRWVYFFVAVTIGIVAYSLSQDGQVYYKLADASQSPQYFFKKGNTFMWVMPFPQDVFPEGVMTHLVPVGNPIGK